MNQVGPERSNGVAHGPSYRWEKSNGGGYHLDNAAVADVLPRFVFAELARLPRGSVVADFGCGNGRVQRQAPEARNRPYIFRGFDLSRDSVERFNRELDPPDRAEVADISTLDLGSTRFAAALAWRSLHGIPPELHDAVLASIHAHLEPEGRFYAAALSDRDWKPKSLKEEGGYKPGELNDYAGVMKIPGVEEWRLYAFRKGELPRLGERVGFNVVRTAPIQELTGYEELLSRHPNIDYDFVEFKKP